MGTNCTRKVDKSPRTYATILAKYNLPDQYDEVPKLSDIEQEFDHWGSKRSSLSQAYRNEESNVIVTNSLNSPGDGFRVDNSGIKKSSYQNVPQRLGQDSSVGKKPASFETLKADHNLSDALIVLKLDGLPVDNETDDAGCDPRSSLRAISPKHVMLNVPPPPPKKDSKLQMKQADGLTKRKPERFSEPVFPLKDQPLLCFNDDSDSNNEGGLSMNMEEKDHESKNTQFKSTTPRCLMSKNFIEKSEVIPENEILHPENNLNLDSFRIDLAAPLSLSFDNLIDLEDEDGGGYLGNFDRDIPLNLSVGEVLPIPEPVGFSGRSDPYLGDNHSVSSFVLSENSIERNYDRSRPEESNFLSIRLSSDNCELIREPINKSSGFCDFKEEESTNTIVIDYQNQGPPTSIHRTESSISSHSMLRTDPRPARMSLSCVDLSNCSEDPVSGNFLNSKTPIISKNKVKKPDRRRFLGLQSPVDQQKHYEDALIECWPLKENTIDCKSAIGNIIEHVLVEEEEWERMFGVYSSTVGKHKDWIHGLDLDPGGNHIVSGGNDNLVHVWDTKEPIGKVSSALNSLSASDAVSSVMFLTPQQIVVGTQSEMIIWNWEENPKKFVNYFDRSAVMCLAKIPNQADLFLAGQESGELAIWNVNRHKPVLDFDGTSKVTGVTTVSNGSVLVSCARDSTINFWDQRTGQIITTFQAASDPKQLKWVNGLCALNDHTIATARADNTINIWDRRKNPLTACLSSLTGHDNYVWDVKAVGESGLLSASSDSKLKLWDWKRGKEKQDLKGSKRTVFTLATNGDDKLFSAGMDHYVRSWTFWI